MESVTNRKDTYQWTTIIKPTHGLFDIRLREVIRYRDLVVLFVKRDFVTKYKQTILGPLWYIIQPLITTVMFTFVFGNMARISTDGIPYVLFYYGGTMLWTYFETCFKDSSDTFITNANLFGKVYFPRLTVPLSRLLINLIALGIQFIMFIVFYIYFVVKGTNVLPTLHVILLPLVIFWLAGLGIGLGLIISAITTKYRDLKQLVSFGVGLWMYATPIPYPLSQMPHNLMWIFYVNPVSAPIELFRVIMFGAGYVPPSMLISSIIITIITICFGLVVFTKNERTFVDVV